ncbi:hypothetical protein [Okeania sp. SIO2C2]
MTNYGRTLDPIMISMRDWGAKHTKNMISWKSEWAK